MDLELSTADASSPTSDYRGLGHLPFTVVRIKTSDLRGAECYGTGFFFVFEFGEHIFEAVVSNKHVLMGKVGITLTMPRAGRDGRRSLEQGFDVTLGGTAVLGHPDPKVDLAIIPLQPYVKQAAQQGVKTAPVCMSAEALVLPEEEAELYAATSVLMVGFPEGLMDEHNSLPLIRRGTLATPYAADYKGAPNFVVDIAAFGGSSGSPVFSFFDGFRTTSSGVVMMGKTSLHLIGILHSGPVFNREGRIIDVPVPTESVPVTQQMINLGYCAKAKLLRDFVPIIRAITGVPRA